jgi:chemotaxis protein methyltransferase WspC
MNRFEQFLLTRIGLDARSLGAQVLERIIQERLLATHSPDRDAYWQLLERSTVEQQALIEAVVVPETWFFRDPEALLALAMLAQRRLLQIRPDQGLRLLSLPCSSGEEPYSMAMALLDTGIAAQRFRIDAIDISGRVVDQARRGIYGSNAFRGRTLDYRARHFTVHDNNRHRLNDNVRACVELRQGNLFDASLLASAGPYDFIFSRNVLIYLDSAHQRQTAVLLEALLAEGGTLFVGPSETPVLLRHGMQSLGLPLAFAFARGPAPASHQPPAPDAAPVRARPVLPAAAARRIQPAIPAPATLEQAQLLADQGRWDAALALCEQLLHDAPRRAGGNLAGLYYLLALIHDARGDALTAGKLLRKTLYLESDHEGAMAHLAALLDLQGDRNGAAQLRQRARRVMHKQAK